MTVNRVEIVERNFRDFVSSFPKAPESLPREFPIRPGGQLNVQTTVELFESQLLSRHADYAARKLRARNQGFYTIGSAGHEGNVALGRVLRHTDPALLHYRSGAFMMERGRKLPSEDVVLNTMLSFCAAVDDPISGGRHKVWGSAPLWVPPQTSTIASHLPKALGMALALERARRLRLPLPIPEDSVVMCSFGDASVNHAVAQTAFNAARWAEYQHLPLPLIFLCEDNGIGISVWTPSGWIESQFSNRKGLHYIQANGLDLLEAHGAAEQAVEICRRTRDPVFLHLKVVRLLGHAGSDMETEYLSPKEIEAFEARDPLLRSAEILMETGALSPAEVLELYDSCRSRVEEAAAKAEVRPRLRSADQIMAPLAPYHPKEVQAEARRKSDRAETIEHEKRPRHMAVLINMALAELLTKYPEMLIFGEDVAKKGGVYHVTTGLQKKFGAGRVFNTLLDETTILGMGIGAAHLGFLPVPEIQYLAYYHNAEDQIRAEAASLQYFSNMQFRNPMVVRIASLGYQKGFGGHFHNDNSIAALRDVPGIVIAVPARGDDAVGMLRTLMALGKVDGRVSFFLEPIALYMTKDLLQEGDGGWQCEYPPPDFSVPIGEGRLYRPESEDATIITYANGLYLSLRAADKLEREHGIRVRVLDIRWIQPLPLRQIEEEASRTGKVVLVDECRRTGGISEAIAAHLWSSKKAGELKVSRVTAEDTYIPLGTAAEAVLPSENQIIAAIRAIANPK